jgi:hypothetical protein
LKPQRKNLCGTPEGYERHLQRAERPCEDCLDGSSTYTDLEIARQIESYRKLRHDQRLWEHYGILRVTYEQIFEAQGRTCACCEKTDPQQEWHVDFDPAGNIRGILCADCNLGIELLGDDLTGLQRAAAYLQSHADRGGHARHLGPGDFTVRPDPSKLMDACFKHFDAGLSIGQVVVQEKLEPNTARNLHAFWKSRRPVS